MEIFTYPAVSPGKSVHYPPALMKRVIMRMQIIIFILTFGFVHAAGNVNAQQVTLTAKDEKLAEVFQKLREQTGYRFNYHHSDVDQYKVTFSIESKSIHEALDKCLEGLPLTYTLTGKIIIIREKYKADTLKPASYTLNGRVINEKGEPLPGTTIKVNGSSIGTITDGDGIFVIEVKKGDELEFSMLGYQRLTVKINEQKVLEVVLSEGVSSINEVVVKGYYTTTREYNTGNVSTVKAADLARQPVGDPLHALAGNVPGLFIQQQSGVPGYATRVTLRGRNSIVSPPDNGVLYIIDGIPFNSQPLNMGILGGASGGLSPFASLPIGDIERIEVLKDADATSIYGSRGANGVILITTKKGTPGKTSITATVSSGFAEVGSKLNLMNTTQYLAMRNEAISNDNATPGTRDYDLNGAWGDINQYTDWQDVMIGGRAEMTDAQIAVSGGSANTQYRISGGYRGEGTVFPGDYKKKMISSQFSINHKSEDSKFNIGVQLQYANDHNKLPAEDYFTKKIFLAPNAPKLRNDDGSLNWQNSTWYNPLRDIAFISNNEVNNLNSALNANYRLVNNLSIGIRMGYGFVRMNSSNIFPLQGANPANPIDPSQRRNVFGWREDKSWVIEPQANYGINFGKGRFDALIGMVFQNKQQDGISQTARGFASDEIIENIAAATTLVANSVLDINTKYTAIYARLGYIHNSKYVINLTANRDGSSRFGPGKRFGNFGSIAGAWIFSKENFVKSNLPFLTYGKLRASYGITGSDANSDYRYLSTYSATYSNYQGIGGLTPTQLTNPNYHWESVKKLETSLELGIHDRIAIDLTWYRNRTGNQLVSYPLPAITGFQSILANLPAVVQNSGIEIETRTKNIVAPSFQWTTSFNISIPNNKLVSFPNIENTGYVNQFAVGEPLSVSFRYHYTGIDPASGVYTFEDKNKDGSITSAFDRGPIFIGQDFFGGLSNNFIYKGIQLDFSFQFTKQKGTGYNSILPPGAFFADGSNHLSSIMDDIRSGKAQQLTANLASPKTSAYITFINNSDGAVQNISFIRLRNVSLSWNLPAKYISPINIRSARIFCSGQNILTWTNGRVIDPELQIITLPPLRVFMIGIQIGI